jgi:hypothetical protein
VEKNDFDCSADEHGSVKQDHPAKSRFFYFCCAPRNHLSLMAARYLQLHNAEQSDSDEQAEKRDDA